MCIFSSLSLSDPKKSFKTFLSSLLLWRHSFRLIRLLYICIFGLNISNIWEIPLLKHLNISIYALKENQSGLSFFAKALFHYFCCHARFVVSENHKKRGTGCWQDTPSQVPQPTCYWKKASEAGNRLLAYTTLDVPHTGCTTQDIPHRMYHTGYTTHWMYHTGYTTLLHSLENQHWLYFLFDLPAVFLLGQEKWSEP